ncbi:hypothetical protein [Allohahella sp. A8]|uniref:hypothetical protein n=1 Tax=Allohahella sp. A8 TaxID=3141461 RepID=UPI000C0B0C8E|nr:hypothetical protein [Hahellaceae bacterium]
MDKTPVDSVETEIKKEPKKSLVVIAIVSICEIIIGLVVILNADRVTEKYLNSAGWVIMLLGVAGLVLYALYRKPK